MQIPTQDIRDITKRELVHTPDGLGRVVDVTMNFYYKENGVVFSELSIDLILIYSVKIFREKRVYNYCRNDLKKIFKNKEE